VSALLSHRCTTCGKTTYEKVGSMIVGMWYCFTCAQRLNAAPAEAPSSNERLWLQDYAAMLQQLTSAPVINKAAWEAANQRFTEVTTYLRSAAETTCSGWQPIETGPHSGIAVLLWQPWKSGRDCTTIGHYANGWVDHRCEDLLPEPTHWMPLPDSPGKAEAQSVTPAKSGYEEAFWRIAEALDLPAMPVSPKEAFETVMLPKILAATDTVKRVTACLEPHERYGVRVKDGHTEEFWAALAAAFAQKTSAEGQS
jgi:hypothetical protein